MKNDKGFLGLFLAALVFLPGCLHVPIYKSRSLQSISDHCTYRGVQKNIVVRAKDLSQAEKSYLLNDRSALRDDELHAIYLSIHNLSNTPYTFSYDTIQVKSCDVTRSMKKTSSVARLSGSVAMGAITYGAVTTANALLVPISGAALLIALPIAAVAGCFGIFTAICSSVFLGVGIKSIVMNRRMHKDLREKTLHEPVVIKSAEHYEGLIFVKAADYQSEFVVTMHQENKKHNTLVFDVDLHASVMDETRQSLQLS